MSCFNTWFTKLKMLNLIRPVYVWVLKFPRLRSPLPHLCTTVSHDNFEPFHDKIIKISIFLLSFSQKSLYYWEFLVKCILKPVIVGVQMLL